MPLKSDAAGPQVKTWTSVRLWKEAGQRGKSEEEEVDLRVDALVIGRRQVSADEEAVGRIRRVGAIGAVGELRKGRRPTLVACSVIFVLINVGGETHRSGVTRLPIDREAFSPRSSDNGVVLRRDTFRDLVAAEARVDVWRKTIRSASSMMRERRSPDAGVRKWEARKGRRGATYMFRSRCASCRCPERPSGTSCRRCQRPVV